MHRWTSQSEKKLRVTLDRYELTYGLRLQGYKRYGAWIMRVTYGLRLGLAARVRIMRVTLRVTNGLRLGLAARVTLSATVHGL